MRSGADEQQLRAMAHDLVAGFIGERRKAEAILLSAVWEQFVAGGGLRLQAPSHAMPREFGLPFDNDAQEFLATPFVIMTVWAVLKELNVRKWTPSSAEIDAAIRSCARELGTPALLTDELAESVGAKLAELFGQPELPSSPTTLEGATDGQAVRFLVDWVDARTDDVLSTPSPDRRTISEPEVERRFRARSRDFALFIDEPRVLIQAAVATANLWHRLAAQHRAFLLLVLEGFRRGVIDYDTIYESVFAESVSERDDLAPARSRVKSELDTMLGGLLKDHLRAARGQYRYELVGHVAYCWIRCADAPSLLGDRRR